MPMYEFTCEACEHGFETLIRNARDEKEVRCPKCDSEKARRTISLPARPATVTSGGGNACGEGPPCGAPWCGRKNQ